MAVGIVELLEIIYVKHEKRQVIVSFLRLLEFNLKVVLKIRRFVSLAVKCGKIMHLLVQRAFSMLFPLAGK